MALLEVVVALDLDEFTLFLLTDERIGRRLHELQIGWAGLGSNQRPWD
jgi:hypothetical protein